MNKLGDDPKVRAALQTAHEQIRLRAQTGVLDRAAEGTVRAFRDGVPPNHVREVTVDQDAALSKLQAALTAIRTNRSHRPLGLVAASGNGRTHMLRWLGETAELAGLAVGRTHLSDWTSVDPEWAQGVALRSIRVGGRSLEDAVTSLTPQRLSPGYRKALSDIASGSSPTGVKVLSLLWEAWRHGRTEEAVTVLSWMRGEVIDDEWRKSRGLPRSRSLAQSLEGTIQLCLGLVRLFGANGVALLIDAEREALHPHINPLLAMRIPGFLVALATPAGHLSLAIPITNLAPDARFKLATKLRDFHLRAYVWPDPKALTSEAIATWCSGLREGNTRDFVRSVIQHLDMELAKQEAPYDSLGG